jgi:hypothetical protein
MPFSFASPAIKTIAAIVLATSTVVAVQGRADSESSREAAGTSLVESAECRPGEPDDARKLEPPSARPEGLTVSVRIRPTTLARLDTHGRVASAATNTGCRPRRGDDVYLFLADGSMRQGSWSDVSPCRWQGDFTIAARYQPQQCQRYLGDDDDRKSQPAL